MLLELIRFEMVRKRQRFRSVENHFGTRRFARRDIIRASGAGIGALTLGSLSDTVVADPAALASRLHTEGKWIVDAGGSRVKLRGVATADPAFYWRWHPKTAMEVVEWASDEGRGWYPNTVRLPVTQGYIDHYGLDTVIDDILRPLVDLLGDRGVYAMVDYHLIRPYTTEATDNAETDYSVYPDELLRTFWNRVAPEFAADVHVIYELFNEPTEPAHWGDDEAAWQEWKQAAQSWVDLVQSHAPETPLIIGSPRWTSVTNMAAVDPFDGENLIYSAHIYPANGQPSEFDPTYGAPAEEVPVVVTEFGWDPNGGSVDQGTNSGWGEPFRQWVESYENMGWTAWCFDDSWAPHMFNSPGEGANEPWTLKDGPEQHGGFIKQWLTETEG